MPTNDRDALTAVQRTRIRRSIAARNGDDEEGGHELNVVPFLDIITNVMMFVLASIAIVFTVSIAVRAPASGRKIGVTRPEGLELTVLVLKDGYFLKTRDASIAPGCRAVCVGSCGATVPRVAASSDESLDRARYDADALTACARTLKDAFESDAPELARETQVMISANPDVPFQEVVRAMDALRRDGRGELFSDVALGVWR
jgi:biopolymer transport protein ExbD